MRRVAGGGSGGQDGREGGAQGSEGRTACGCWLLRWQLSRKYIRDNYHLKHPRILINNNLRVQGAAAAGPRTQPPALLPSYPTCTY